MPFTFMAATDRGEEHSAHELVGPRRLAVTTPAKRGLLLIALALCYGVGWGSPRAAAQATPESKSVVLVGHNDLNGHGNGGEGLAIQQWPDGRRLLYLAHEGEDWCLSIVDVTHPEKPVMVAELPSPTPGIARYNSLGLSGNVLAVADQSNNQGHKTAGMRVLDVSDFSCIQKPKRCRISIFPFLTPPGRTPVAFTAFGLSTANSRI